VSTVIGFTELRSYESFAVASSAVLVISHVVRLVVCSLYVDYVCDISICCRYSVVSAYSQVGRSVCGEV
jgi:hypothetical protein